MDEKQQQEKSQEAKRSRRPKSVIHAATTNARAMVLGEDWTVDIVDQREDRVDLISRATEVPCVLYTSEETLIIKEASMQGKLGEQRNYGLDFDTLKLIDFRSTQEVIARLHDSDCHLSRVLKQSETRLSISQRHHVKADIIIDYPPD